MFVIQPISGRWESNFGCRVFRSKREKAAEIIRIVQSCESGMAEDLSRAARWTSVAKLGAKSAGQPWRWLRLQEVGFVNNS